MKKRTTYKKTQGFTLLEIVVVIVIIGILFAAAIPQYQKVVWRSRFAEVYSTVSAIARAEEAYYYEHGAYTKYATVAECQLGNGVPTGSTPVQRDLGISIPANSFFVYMVYPSDSCPSCSTTTAVYFAQPGYDWAWLYNYAARTWSPYGAGNGGPARLYFTPPS